MTVPLRCSADLPLAAAFDGWFATASALGRPGLAAALPAEGKLEDLGRALISVAYAGMEPTDGAVAVPVDIGWRGVAPGDAAPKVLVSEAPC